MSELPKTPTSLVMTLPLGSNSLRFWILVVDGRSNDILRVLGSPLLVTVAIHESPKAPASQNSLNVLDLLPGLLKTWVVSLFQVSKLHFVMKLN